MDRINGAGTIDIGGGKRGFRDENLGTGTEGTEVTADFVNASQEEIMKVIEGVGLAPDDGDWTQLWQALHIIGFKSSSRRWTAVVSMTLTVPPGAPQQGDTYLVPAGATGVWAANVGKIAEWTGSAWSYVTPPDGHGVGLPDGRVFRRRAGAYVELAASSAGSQISVSFLTVNQGAAVTTSLTDAELVRAEGFVVTATSGRRDISYQGTLLVRNGAVNGEIGQLSLQRRINGGAWADMPNSTLEAGYQIEGSAISAASQMSFPCAGRASDADPATGTVDYRVVGRATGDATITFSNGAIFVEEIAVQ